MTSATTPASTSADRPTRVRIAPSPTGDPHVGTAYIGLLNYLFAAQRGGKFVLRIEDTDRIRFVATSEQMIFDALKWVGLQWDEGPDVGGPFGPYRQSERTDIYREHVQKLLASGHAYRSFETAEELEAMRQSQIAAKQPPRYNGAHRELTPAQIAAFETEGRPAVIRLKVPATGSTTFRDELRGEITFDHSNVDDQVLLKSDGFPTYHLANVVDDHLMQITDVIRAEEWISSTPKHVLLYQAFGWEMPRFWHMPLLRNADKSKISKRKNPVSLNFYRDSGYLPQALLNFLGLMGGGMAQPTEQEIVSQNLNTKEGDIFSLAEMIAKYDFARISLGGPVFDLVKLKWLNGEYIRKLSPESFVAALRSSVLSDAHIAAMAPLIQSRINILGEFGDIAGFLFSDEVDPPEAVWLPKGRTVEETLSFIEKILSTLEGSPWDTTLIERNIFRLGSENLVPHFLSWLKPQLESTDYQLGPDDLVVIEKLLDRFYEDEANLKVRLGIGNEKSIRVYREKLQSLEITERGRSLIENVITAFTTYIRQTRAEWSVAESFMLLRAIMTGKKQSPPILDSMIVLGKARSLDRIRRFMETQKRLAAQHK